jgi:hypothetical protein
MPFSTETTIMSERNVELFQRHDPIPSYRILSEFQTKIQRYFTFFFQDDALHCVFCVSLSAETAIAARLLFFGKGNMLFSGNMFIFSL